MAKKCSIALAREQRLEADLLEISKRFDRQCDEKIVKLLQLLIKDSSLAKKITKLRQDGLTFEQMLDLVVPDAG